MYIWKAITIRFWKFWQELSESAERYHGISETVRIVTLDEATRFDVNHQTKLSHALSTSTGRLDSTPSDFQEQLAARLSGLRGVPLTANTIKEADTVAGLIEYIFDHEQSLLIDD